MPSPKILLARLQHYVDCELSDVQEKVVLEMAEEPEIKLPTSIGSSKTRESSRKTKKVDVFLFGFIDYAKAFACVDHNKQWKILREM